MTTKQQRYRERMREAGLRPVQIWLPDTRSPRFAAECRRQAQRINAEARAEDEALAFIDRAADWDGDPEGSR
ncbi:MAG: antitoxin MazE family protein [Halofilum sp. (in: g-proteobacteria)]